MKQNNKEEKMSNQFFEHILEQNIDNFVRNFKIWSRSIYENCSSSLIHPGEFGYYREKLCHDFLSHFIPQTMAIGSGFVLDKEGFVSNQNDIIVYDKENMPIIEDLNKQRFFPIENVLIVCEVKSKLQKKDFEESLKRLAKIKYIRAQLKNPYIEEGNNAIENWDYVNGRKAVYSPSTNHQDQIGTCIICEKLDFDFMNFEFSSFYQSNDSGKINMILSLDDGVFLYKHSDNYLHPYPFIHGEKDNFCICQDTNSDNFMPIKIFVNNFFVMAKCCTRLSSEICEYMTIDKSLKENILK